MWLQQLVGMEVPSGNGELNRQCLRGKCWLCVTEDVAVLQQLWVPRALPQQSVWLWPFLHQGSFWRMDETDKLALDFKRHRCCKGTGGRSLGH